MVAAGTYPRPVGTASGRRGPRAAPVLAAVAVTVVLVLTLIAMSSGRLVPFPEMRGTVAWQVDEGAPGEAIGGWVTADTLVYGARGGLAAYEMSGGREAWRFAPGQPVCAMSQHAPDGLGVLLLARPVTLGEIGAEVVPVRRQDRTTAERLAGELFRCDLAVLIDARTGAERWRTELPVPDPANLPNLLRLRGDPAAAFSDRAAIRLDGELLVFDAGSGSGTVRRDASEVDPEQMDGNRISGPSPRGAHAEILGEGVVVRLGEAMIFLDTRSGDVRWQRDQFSASDTTCPVTDFLGRDDSVMVVATDCGIDGSVTIHTADLSTGDDVSAFAFPRGQSQPNMDLAAPTRLVATDPVVVWIDLAHSFGPGTGGYTENQERRRAPRVQREQILAFGDDGRMRYRLEVGDLFAYRRSALASSRAPLPFVLDEERIYAASRNPSCRNYVRSFELATGELVWETELGDMRPHPIGVQDDRLLVVRSGLSGECALFRPTREWQFYTLDIRSGSDQPMTRQLPARLRPHQSFHPEMWWHGGRVYHIDGRSGALRAYR